MMSLLCHQYDDQIGKWYAEYISLVNLPSFTCKGRELKEHIEQYTIEIITNKEYFFFTGSVSTWALPINGTNKHNQDVYQN